MVRRTIGLVTVLTAGPALAQPFGTAQFWWEASADNGATWSRDLLEVDAAQPSVRVRARTSWEPRAGEGVDYHYFSGSRFDVVITGVDGAGPGDLAHGFHRTQHLDSWVQTIGATRFGNTIKIDDTRDTSAPGGGSRWVTIAQPPEQFWDMGRFQTANPIQLFEFTLTLDGSLGERHIGQVFGPLTDAPGHPSRYFLATWIGPTGGLNYPDGEGGVFDLRIHVVPAPAAAALLALAAFGPRRRRR